MVDEMMKGYALAQGDKGRTFDWDKAARIIRERDIKNAYAGLQSDLQWTCGMILKDGEIVEQKDTYVYLSSMWAVPVLVLDDGEEIDCGMSGIPDKDPYWPGSARAILSAS